MGDMKTPDFDDLLAAFDIPDMVDPKAAIESGHDDHEGQIKHSVHVEEDSHVPPVPDVGVSVIVKNIRNVDATEPVGAEKENHSTGNGLHNGFVAMSSIDRYTKDPGKSLKGEGHDVVTKESSFNQFSPISSAEEFDDDDDDKIEVDDPPAKQVSRPCYQANPLTGFASKQEQDRPKGLGGDSLAKPMQNNEHNKVKTMKRENNKNLVNLSLYEQPKASKTEEKLKESAQKPQDVKGIVEKTGVNVACTSQAKAKSSAKLSFCIAAIAALSAKKATLDTVPQPQSSPSDSPKEIKESLRVINKPMNPQSPIAKSKKLFTKQPDSPSSVSSEGSSKGSPSSLAGSTPAIPKVRIKTIKTSSGQIKRTVTSVLPDLNREVCKKGLNQASSIVVSSILSSATSTTVFSSPSRTVQTTVVATTASSTTEMTSKQVTIKPVATAFLPVSAVKTAGSQVINLKLANNTMVKATVIPATSVQSASSALVFYNKCSLLSHARGHKDKGVVMQCSHLILKPIPADQMIASPFPTSVVATTAIHNPTTTVNAVAKTVAAALSTVISAPSSAPVVPAMPLDEDPSKLCRHSLKCLECSEVFQDEASLAMHYQQAVESSGQKTCNVCQMLLPNQCSFASHQRIHQHKSPYTCPECGAICRSVHFQTHVTKSCLHYTRRVGYRLQASECMPECPALRASLPLSAPPPTSGETRSSPRGGRLLLPALPLAARLLPQLPVLEEPALPLDAVRLAADSIVIFSISSARTAYAGGASLTAVSIATARIAPTVCIATVIVALSSISSARTAYAGGASLTAVSIATARIAPTVCIATVIVALSSISSAGVCHPTVSLSTASGATGERPCLTVSISTDSIDTDNIAARGSSDAFIPGLGP
ncbi:UNVERIFIED_CONTAM: hypothetical protein FKN15_017357 [Acipenser sinensis]